MIDLLTSTINARQLSTRHPKCQNIIHLHTLFTSFVLLHSSILQRMYLHRYYLYTIMMFSSSSVLFNTRYLNNLISYQQYYN